jgi:hypothetical protein
MANKTNFARSYGSPASPSTACFKQEALAHRLVTEPVGYRLETTLDTSCMGVSSLYFAVPILLRLRLETSCDDHHVMISPTVKEQAVQRCHRSYYATMAMHKNYTGAHPVPEG